MNLDFADGRLEGWNTALFTQIDIYLFMYTYVRLYIARNINWEVYLKLINQHYWDGYERNTQIHGNNKEKGCKRGLSTKLCQPVDQNHIMLKH